MLNHLQFFTVYCKVISLNQVFTVTFLQYFSGFLSEWKITDAII